MLFVFQLKEALPEPRHRQIRKPHLIVNSYATGTVQGWENIGGLIGTAGGDQQQAPTVKNSYATGGVVGSYMNGAGGAGIAGGLIGENYGSVSNSYALGDVAGVGGYTAGLIGYNYGTIKNVFSAGKVDGNSSGLVAYGNSSHVVDSYWDTQSSGQSTSGGGGTGKTTTEMYMHSTYTNWDFANTWGINEGQSYPFLLYSPAAKTAHYK